MLDSEIARGIIKREEIIGYNVHAGPADTSIFDVTNGNSIADTMALARVSWTRADKSPGSRKQGWQKLRSMMKASLNVKAGKPMEEPGLFVFDNCRQWIRTVPVLPRDERDADDVDTNAEDHTGDETRYRVMDTRSEIEVRKLGGT